MNTWTFYGHMKFPHKIPWTTLPKTESKTSRYFFCRREGEFENPYRMSTQDRKKKKETVRKRLQNYGRWRKGEGKRARERIRVLQLWKLKGHMWFIVDSRSSPSSVSLISCVSHPSYACHLCFWKPSLGPSHDQPPNPSFQPPQNQNTTKCSLISSYLHFVPL